MPPIASKLDRVTQTRFASAAYRSGRELAYASETGTDRRRQLQPLVVPQAAHT